MITKANNTKKAAFLTFVVVSLKRFIFEKTETNVCKSKLFRSKNNFPSVFQFLDKKRGPFNLLDQFHFIRPISILDPQDGLIWTRPLGGKKRYIFSKLSLWYRGFLLKVGLKSHLLFFF